MLFNDPRIYSADASAILQAAVLNRANVVQVLEGSATYRVNNVIYALSPNDATRVDIILERLTRESPISVDREFFNIKENEAVERRVLKATTIVSALAMLVSTVALAALITCAVIFALPFTPLFIAGVAVTVFVLATAIDTTIGGYKLFK